MLRTVNDQLSLWDAILPPELLVLPDELGRVDGLLDDPVFFAPSVPFFDPRSGRPSVPMETYLRMMFLKFRYRLGYQTLCREVGDSISWQRFCRIPFGTRVPHPTTLMKLTRRCGDAAVAGLNDSCWPKQPSTSCCAPTRSAPTPPWWKRRWPISTNSGLLAKAVGAMTRTIRRIQAAGGATRTRVRDRRRSAGQRPARSQPSCGCVARRHGRRAKPRYCGSPGNSVTSPNR